MMSHEIRTPLNGILGMADLLMADDLSDSQMEFIKIIRESGEGLLSVINEILDISRIESGKLQLDCVDYDLLQALESVIELLAGKARDKDIEIACRIDDELPNVVTGDPVRLRQVLINLLGNAVKFTEEGGVIMGVDLLGIHDGHAALRFEVSDTGIGIPEEKIESLFEKFVQIDSSSSREHEGAGLGLAICRELIGLMGGKIKVESVLGLGSTFTFVLELPVSDEAINTNQVAVGHGLFEQKVLVIDDQDTSRSVIDHYLRSAGAEVVSVSSGVAGLGELARQSFDLIIVDHMMPGMDGPSFADAVKTLKLEKLPRLILSSSAGYACTHSEAHSLGFDAALCKPVRKTSFEDALREVYGRATGEKTGRCAPAPVADQTREIAPHVLLAEDNHVNQVLTKTQLERRGYVVDVAGNGNEAISMFAGGDYDVVIMDMRMPETDGLEATRLLRKTDKGKSVPIIAMTANAMVGDQEKCMAAGMDDYIAKPVEWSLLLEKIAHWTLRHGADNEADTGAAA